MGGNLVANIMMKVLKKLLNLILKYKNSNIFTNSVCSSTNKQHLCKQITIKISSVENSGQLSKKTDLSLKNTDKTKFIFNIYSYIYALFENSFDLF